MDIQAQVVGVVSGQTTTGRQKWTVQFSNGQSITAWEYSVAAKAQQAQQQGAVVTARIQEKPNPRGGNPYKNLTAVFLPGEAVIADLSPQVTQNPSQGTGGRQNGSGGFSGGMSPEDKVRVTKLSCLSTAAAVFSGSGDLDSVLEAAKTIFNEVYPQAAPVVAAEPAAVAQFVAAEAGQPLVQVGTESVAQQPVAALPWTAA